MSKYPNRSAISAIAGACTCGLEGVALAPIVGTNTTIITYQNAYNLYKSKHNGHLNIGRKILFATIGICSAPIVVAENLIEGMIVAPGKGVRAGFKEGFTKGCLLAPFSIFKAKGYTVKKTRVHPKKGQQNNTHPNMGHVEGNYSRHSAPTHAKTTPKNGSNAPQPAPNLQMKPNC